jgi:hypothetical protein
MPLERKYWNYQVSMVSRRGQSLEIKGIYISDSSFKNYENLTWQGAIL